MNPFQDEKTFLDALKREIETLYAIPYEHAEKRHTYQALARLTQEAISDQWREHKQKIATARPKQMHYFSMEFLIGRIITSNLEALGVRDIVDKALKQENIELSDIEAVEVDAGLGTGGLGRLGACFLDSLAAQDLPGHGNGIRYRYGLFEQKIQDGRQIEVPDDWLKDTYPWEIRVEEEAVDILFGANDAAECIRAVPYDIAIVGARGTVNTLRLWNAEPSDAHPPHEDAIHIDRDIRNISGFLYPDDTTDEGKQLRIKQQYFFSAAGMRSILSQHYASYETFDNLSEQRVFQINDTHASLIIPEMMRIFCDEYGIDWDTAFSITRACAAYTNHTLLAEALEKWPVRLLQPLLPRIYEIIERLDANMRTLLSEKQPHNVEKLAIVKHGHIHMAHLAIAGSFSVNGVAQLHTDILQNVEMKDFNSLYPGRFNNKTNGVTHRRWLAHVNRPLAHVLDRLASGWRDDPDKLTRVSEHLDNRLLLTELERIKAGHKLRLAQHIEQAQGILLDPESLFDVHVKRLHEYKRQLMNAMRILIIYQRLKTDSGYKQNFVPHSFIFGAKAAATYTFAKKIIRFINALAAKVNADPDTHRLLRVVFVENYNVTCAERIVPACDLSEQISTASKEASGTGNMKFMMNGALTIGTLDGANVEIAERVGEDNIFIFGMSSDEVNERNARNDHDPTPVFKAHPRIKNAFDALTETYFGTHHVPEIDEIRQYLLDTDRYYVFADLPDYLAAHEKAMDRYKDPAAWHRSALVNIAQSGYFSSDRTIRQYAREIWDIRSL